MWLNTTVSSIKETMKANNVFAQHQGSRSIIVSLLFPNSFPHGSQISLSHAASFVCCLLQAVISQTAAILDARVFSKIASWREGYGGSEGEECVFSADRCAVQQAHWTQTSLVVLHTACSYHWQLFIAVWRQQPHKQTYPYLTFVRFF